MLVLTMDGITVHCNPAGLVIWCSDWANLWRLVLAGCLRTIVSPQHAVFFYLT